MRCPVCEESAATDRRQVRTAVYVFCCDRCAPRIRLTFEEERASRDEGARRGHDHRRDRDPGAAA